MAGAVEATLAGELGVGRGSGARCRERADGLAAALLVDAELAHLGTEATFDGSVQLFVRLGKVSKFPFLFFERYARAGDAGLVVKAGFAVV